MRSIKVAASCRRFLLGIYARERWRPQGCELSPSLFLLHINDMLKDSSIHCYADDNTVEAVYSGRASLSRVNVDQCRSKLVFSVEASLQNDSLWGERNMIQFNQY